MKGAVGELVYRISLEYYSPEFNRHPEETLNKLKEKRQDENPLVAEIMGRVYDYYSGVYEFEIPGIGNLKNMR
ncbi:MAG: hypothetical protein HY365_03665 [Candidatus Aenigmarchaeota archaeon]|nr:hypothetical protein [Candidatus Aenigmarchaeota archaeon]